MKKIFKISEKDLQEINGASAPAKVAKEDFPDFTIPQKKRGRKKKENYVDPEVFKAQILQFYKDKIITNELGKTIYDIATRLGFAPNFINYTYKEEMISDAVVKMFHALINQKFDPNRINKAGVKGNPYSYYTKIAFNAFRNRIKKEKRSQEAVLEYQSSVYDTLVHTGNISDTPHDENTGEVESEY